MAGLLDVGLCAALVLLPGAQSGGKEKSKVAQKSAPPPPLQVFTGKLADARKLARERNAGLLIHILLKDMESENTDYRKKFLEEPGLLTACERVIVLVSDNGTHPPRTVEETLDGQKRTRTACSVYTWYENCGQHQQNFNDLALEYRDEDGDLHCPQTLLQAPDGSLAARLNTSAVGDPGEILAALVELKKKFGPGLLEPEWFELTRALERARTAQASSSWPEALRSWTRVRELSPLSVYGAEAAKNLPDAQQGLAAAIERIGKGFVPGSAAESWKQLVEMQRVCAGLPVEKEIAARLKRAEAQKDLQAEIAQVKLEAEAAALLRTAQELADARKDKELEKTVRKLLGPRYAATPAAASARTLWPEWAK